jgi:hypothetical protein
MFKKIAVALVAATMLTVPALAQGSADTKSGATPAKVVTVHKSAKYAKVNHGKITHGQRYAVRYHRHVKHVVHVKHVEYMRAAATEPTSVKHHVHYAKRHVHYAKHHVHYVAHKPSHRAYSAATPSAKPKSGTN